ncbi:Sialic acid TRAP transporter permease protein SiaT [subsurface metagenome]
MGIATPTEAAACGTFGSIIIAACYRRLSFRSLFDACTNTLGTMGMFGGVIIGAMCFTAIFAGLGGRQIVYGIFTSLNVQPVVLLLITLGMIVILGMFIDWIAILLIIVPTMMPIATTMGWDQLWFGMLICITLQTAWLSPPFGYSLFFLKGLNLPGITFAHIAWGCVPFIGLQLIGVGLCVAFPQIVLWLPNLLIK